MKRAARGVAFPLAIALSLTCVAELDCSLDSYGLTPLIDLGPQLYLGQFQGGLYPGGANEAPPIHHDMGLRAAAEINALERFALVSVGPSNARNEWCAHQDDALECNPWTFMGQAEGQTDPRLTIINGAREAQPALNWTDPVDNENYDVIDQRLADAGLTPNDAVAFWLKSGGGGPNHTLPSATANAYNFFGSLRLIIDAIEVRYPNVKAIYLSSRGYSGYSDSTSYPEPIPYESGFSVKWLIEQQIEEGDYEGAWLGWASYFWADGVVPRSDGLTWQCTEYVNDGIHLNPDGEEKVAGLLLDFFTNSPYTRSWFAPQCEADVSGDDVVDINDLLVMLGQWGPCLGCNTDFNGDGVVDVDELLTIIAAWGPCE